MTAGWNDLDDPPLKTGASEQADDISIESLPEYQRPPPRKIDQYINASIPHLSRRATVSLLCCLGFIIMFGMRETMGMVNSEIEDKDRNSTNRTTMSRSTISAIESAIFWGYFITQIPGGLIAAAYPANKLFGAAIGSSCILNLFVPVLYDNPTGLIIVKVLQGLVEGVTYPACHGIMRYWAPPLERSRLATIAFSGCYAGVMFSMMVCGILMKNISLFAPFYFYSVIGVVWYICWLWLVFEKPSLHTCIEPKELIMIEKSLGSSQQHYTNPTLSSTPWKAFFTSLPCYAIFVANFCRSWNFYLLVLFQASYFKEAFGTTTAENASLGALPHFLMTLVVPAGGIMADRLRKKGILNTTQVRKLFNCGGFGLEATFFIAMAYSHTTLQGMTALTIGVAFSGFAISGFNVNHLDIAPRYASILMGLSNGIGTVAGAIVPIIKNSVVVNGTKEQWRILIILSAFIHYAGIIFYGIFASGELQPWADPTAEEEKQWNQMNETVPVNKYTSQSNGLLQRQPSGGVTNYGSHMETALPPRPSAAPRQMPPDPPTRPPAPQVYPQEQYQSQQVVPSANPFISGAISRNPFRQEAVQPEPQDAYMHGTIDDRTY
ncbi:vesicular glutamate transporter 1 [Dendroctonus ponderosae]|uniref:vesicular glutamate transporter 1 n=1 Tax=Dendroctonus ponderosae TaxID=77166 RepID=UPI002035B1AC|nr:vesicular glutamate transporter 1 [Dendroctonus ponderosae]